LLVTLHNGGASAKNASMSERAQQEQAAQQELVVQAKAGGSEAFSELVRLSLPKLRAVIYRMIPLATEAEDLIQESLTKAWLALRTFDGRAAFSTWLCSIGVRHTIDYLRKEKRWRTAAQVALSNECAITPEMGSEVQAVVSSPDFSFDVHEHIAFCFGCVGRSLEPEQQSALVLREVLDHSNDEAAEIMGLSESVFRHKLRAARQEMQQAYEGLCSLVSKQGVCYQCKGLRDFVGDPERQGEVVPEALPWEQRLVTCCVINCFSINVQVSTAS
jgi:RNA polymerase sigma-70 factor, ECF subfamily